MKAEVVNWITHPVTLTLIGGLIFGVMVLAEILQRRRTSISRNASMRPM